MQGFSGVILAGGASRRMGRDKAGIKIGQQTMLGRMWQLLHLSGATRITILGRPELPGGVPDRVPHAGPVAALTDFLATQPVGSKHLVVPVDMPSLDPAMLRTLAAQNRWTFFDSHMLPLLAVAGPTISPPPRRLKDLLADKAAHCLPLKTGSPETLVNLNTPDELQCWRRSRWPREGASHHV